jgi:uncharacterized alpha-E superfamily protein
VRRQVTAPVAAGYLLRDSLFPRAVLHSLGQIRACLKSLPRNTSAVRAVGRVERRVRDADIHEIFPAQFHAFIDEVQVELGGIHDSVQRTWFEPRARG